MFSLLKKIRHLQFPKPSLLCHLFDSLIHPIANHGCEVWGYVKAEDLEVVHRRFCKFALGVPNTATNLAVYGELGRVPLEIKRRSAFIKYVLVMNCTWLEYSSSTQRILCHANRKWFWLVILHRTNIPHIGTQKALSRWTWTKIKGPIYSSMEWSAIFNNRKTKILQTIQNNFWKRTLPPHLRVPCNHKTKD